VTDLRVQQPDSGAERAHSVSRDGSAPRREGGEESPRHDSGPAGAEELAVALAESDRGEALRASYELGSNGEPLIRIVDHLRNETVALITPDELKALAEDTGLPPGLLLRVSS